MPAIGKRNWEYFHRVFICGESGADPLNWQLQLTASMFQFGSCGVPWVPNLMTLSVCVVLCSCAWKPHLWGQLSVVSTTLYQGLQLPASAGLPQSICAQCCEHPVWWCYTFSVSTGHVFSLFLWLAVYFINALILIDILRVIEKCQSYYSKSILPYLRETERQEWGVHPNWGTLSWTCNPCTWNVPTSVNSKPEASRDYMRHGLRKKKKENKEEKEEQKEGDRKSRKRRRR